MAAVLTGEFEHGNHRLVYDEYGAGSRPIVLLPGLLFSRRMHAPLAEALAERGNRVICLDLLGHGDADRPRDMWRYSMPLFAEQVVTLLDHLELDQAVVGGTSLGANVTLEVAASAPERLRGMVVEMPVLDNALLACAVVFAPLLVWLTLGEPVARLVGRGVGLLPRGVSQLADSLIDWAAQDPAPSSAVLQGLFFGRVAPPRAERSRMETPALVIGHPRDPVHPFSDSDMLVRELANSRLVEANSILELRLTPARLTDEIGRFVEECWLPATTAGSRSPRRPTARRASAQ